MDDTTTAVEPTPATAEAILEDVKESDTLTSHDRCDTANCGSQAYVRAILSSGDLLFCNHHYNKVEATIESVAQEVLDERWKLYKTVKLDVSA